MPSRYDIYTDTFADQPEETAMSDTQTTKADARAAKADPTPPTDEQAAAQIEADKAKRAAAGVTGSPNGDYAGVAFASRIAQAQFDHRNQGHDDTMRLIDDLFAAVQRLEAKLA